MQTLHTALFSCHRQVEAVLIVETTISSITPVWSGRTDRRVVLEHPPHAKTFFFTNLRLFDLTHAIFFSHAPSSLSPDPCQKFFFIPSSLPAPPLLSFPPSLPPSFPPHLCCYAPKPLILNRRFGKPVMDDYYIKLSNVLTKKMTTRADQDGPRRR